MMKTKREKLIEDIGTGKRRCVCTEEYRCSTCKEMETLER